MTNVHGLFCWYDVSTGDRKAAADFYGTVLGWGSRPAPSPNGDYTLFTAAGTPLAGMMDLPEEMRRAGIGPRWTGYVAVDDVDVGAALAVQLGAILRVPATDIPAVGRFALFTDPQGAALALFRPLDQGPESMTPGGPSGGVAWHELWTGEVEAAFAFYQRLFGWRKGEAMDMGEMGIYQIFAAGETMLGGMFAKPPVVTTPFWLYYFTVDDIDAGARRAAEAGGRITNGPMAVPGGGWIVQATDPQGAPFALFGQRSG
ncbi:MAG: VOC family protein [Magnetospirillum sp.]|nr:VOC family protein [Magnetospirillum sp.]